MRSEGKEKEREMEVSRARSNGVFVRVNHINGSSNIPSKAKGKQLLFCSIINHNFYSLFVLVAEKKILPVLNDVVLAQEISVFLFGGLHKLFDDLQNYDDSGNKFFLFCLILTMPCENEDHAMGIKSSA